jgi:putative addiction module component (TIGR02574 family)
MSATAEKLLQELLLLPEKERLDLIEQVYESIEVGYDDDSEIDLGPEWDEEIKRRIDDLESGRAKGIPFDEAMKMIMAEDADDAAA